MLLEKVQLAVVGSKWDFKVTYGER